jgi:phosphatidylserine decarboxylase
MTEESMKDRAVISALKVLPRNWMSRAMGKVAGTRLPGPLAGVAVKGFGAVFGVDMGEVKDDLSSFDSVQSFFTRELKEGARPIDEAEDALVSPCDGTWGAAGDVEDGTILQVKGRPYRVAELLADEDAAAPFADGTFATLYLSPRDYHRFHAPCAGRIIRADAIPGTLWPVNNAGVSLVDGLFAQNERIVAYVDTTGNGEADLAMVAVGATMVGKVKVNFADLETNEGGGLRRERYGEAGPMLSKGEEWGRFEFGSTIVLVSRRQKVRVKPRPAGESLRLGTRIGSISK